MFKKNVPPSREEFAYEAIKEAILGGHLLPGEKLNLTTLAEQLNISIIPVNNAIKRLTSEGLIRQKPHHSPYVQEFSARSTNEVLIIRYQLEELALREAIPNITEEDFSQLNEYMDEMEIHKKNDHLYAKTNRAFHMYIYSLSDLPLLCSMIDDLWNKSELNFCRSVFYLVKGMADHSFEEHKELLNAIRIKDIELALNILRGHKNYSRINLLKSLEKHDKEMALVENRYASF